MCVSEECCVCWSWMELWRWFLFKQKTAYEMRMSDWSSDVCSSDLFCDLTIALHEAGQPQRLAIRTNEKRRALLEAAGLPPAELPFLRSEGRRAGQECGRPCRSRCTPYH